MDESLKTKSKKREKREKREKKKKEKIVTETTESQSSNIDLPVDASISLSPTPQLEDIVTLQQPSKTEETQKEKKRKRIKVDNGVGEDTLTTQASKTLKENKLKRIKIEPGTEGDALPTLISSNIIPESHQVQIIQQKSNNDENKTKKKKKKNEHRKIKFDASVKVQGSHESQMNATSEPVVQVTTQTDTPIYETEKKKRRKRVKKEEKPKVDDISIPIPEYTNSSVRNDESVTSMPSILHPPTIKAQPESETFMHELFDNKVSKEKEQASTIKNKVVEKAATMEKIKNKFKRDAKKLTKTNSLIEIFSKIKNKYAKKMRDITIQKQQQLLAEMVEFLESSVEECQKVIKDSKAQYRQIKSLESNISNIESSLLKNVYELNVMLAMRKHESTNRLYIYSNSGNSDTPFL